MVKCTLNDDGEEVIHKVSGREDVAREILKRRLITKEETNLARKELFAQVARKFLMSKFVTEA